MSLQLLAKQMEAKGRKGDSMLVHMTAKEVAALQKMAESAGGSLSVNPETGLVEANFLKRMLPTLVGVGVGMFAGPMAGAAAGAAVGGYQAKRNDQDVAMGALMGGLGGYGGASLGAGLGAAGNAAASQAATAANPAFMGPMPGAAGGFEAAQAGLSGLGTESGRGAFMSKVGGGAGLASDIGMAAAPMMAPGKKPGETPVDDEMYSYTFNPGRTGAERSPSATSAEREYFQSSYSPVRKIRASEYPVYAAQGGLMSLAEGGETAAPAEVAAPTASEAALAYLMGERSSSAPARSPLIDAQLMPAPMASRAPVVGGDNMYAFDPATGTFLRNPNVPGASTSGSPVGTSFSGSGGSYDAPMSQQTIDFFNKETPAQRDARMGEFQNLFNLGPTGAFISALRGDEARAPNFGTLFGVGDDYKSLGVRDYDSRDIGSEGRDVGFSEASTSQQAGEKLAAGGLMGLAKGGMKSGGFVVPADVVSMIGEGNTDAGYSRIKSMIPGATAIKGKDGGQADTVKTSIEGKQPARVAHGEMYIPPETVKRMGGAKKLYAMMDRVRQQATGSRKQIKPVSLKQAMA
jgi:hypothetical protein